MPTGVNPNNNQFYKNVIESLEDYCVFTTDFDGLLTSWNKGAENITGYTDNEVIGKNAAIFFTEEDRAQKKPERELMLASKDGRAVNERWHVKKDGSRFWGSGLVFPLKSDGGELEGYIKIMRDITTTLNVTRALEMERTKLERIFEKAPSFLVLFKGPEHIFERVNEAYLALSGKTDLLGKPFLVALPEMAEQETGKQLQQVFRSGIPYHANEVQLSFETGGGGAPKVVYVNLVFQPDLDMDGNIIGVIAHGYEVTDQVRARQAVVEATEAQLLVQQQKEAFIGIASHELKTPVTSMKAYAQFAEQSLRK